MQNQYKSIKTTISTKNQRKNHHFDEKSTKQPPFRRKINFQYSQPSLQYSQPSLQCSQPSAPWAPGLWSSRDNFSQKFQNFRNVQKPNKLTFPDSQTSQWLPELPKNHFFDEFSKNSKSHEIGRRLVHSMRNRVKKVSRSKQVIYCF